MKTTELTQLEYDILTYIKSHRDCTMLDFLRTDEIKCRIQEKTDYLALLKIENAISIKGRQTDRLDVQHLRVTGFGRRLMERFEQSAAQHNQRHAEQKCAEAKRLQERAEDQANAERRYRTQNKIAITGVLVSLIFPTLSLIIENRARIIELVLKLFG